MMERGRRTATRSSLEKDRQEIISAEFSVLFTQDYLYSKLYKIHDNFDLFLQGVLFFEDNNSVLDEESLKKYAK